MGRARTSGSVGAELGGAIKREIVELSPDDADYFGNRRLVLPLVDYVIHGQDGDTHVTVDLVVDKRGDVIIDGCDMGATPLKFWGDSDYEYWVIVPVEEKDRLLAALMRERGVNEAPGSERAKERMILTLLADLLDDSDEPFGAAKRWLKERGIRHTSDSWI